MKRAAILILFIHALLISCKKEDMDLSFTISGQVFEQSTEEPASGKTIFIFGYDGRPFLRDEIKFKETLVLGEDGKFEFKYSKLFTDNKASRGDQFILITDIDMFYFRDFERETFNILDSLEWNTNYSDLKIYHDFD